MALLPLGQRALATGFPQAGSCLQGDQAKFTFQQRRTKLKRYSNCCRSGLTLIEVIASLLIVSTMILGSVRALHLHIDQAKQSRAKSNAAKAADSLLASWSQGKTFDVPRSGSGSISYGGTKTRRADQFLWRTRVVSASGTARGLNTVRLELFQTPNGTHENTHPTSSVATGSTLTSLPLLTVDVVAYTSPP